MKIVKRDTSIFVNKGDGTSVNYYLFPEYEIHYNEVEPKTTQQWHHHEHTEETLYIIEGQLNAHWRDKDEGYHQLVDAGDIIRVENTPHTFSNDTDQVAKFIVFRFVPEGKDKSKIIKADKHLD